MVVGKDLPNLLNTTNEGFFNKYARAVTAVLISPAD